MAGTQGVTKQVQAINELLSAAIPTLGLVIGAVNLVREMFRRRAAGEPDMTFDDSVQIIYGGGAQLVETSDQWFKDNPEFDPKTGKRRE